MINHIVIGSGKLTQVRGSKRVAAAASIVLSLEADHILSGVDEHSARAELPFPSAPTLQTGAAPLLFPLCGCFQQTSLS